MSPSAWKTSSLVCNSLGSREQLGLLQTMRLCGRSEGECAAWPASSGARCLAPNNPALLPFVVFSSSGAGGTSTALVLSALLLILVLAIGLFCAKRVGLHKRLCQFGKGTSCQYR